MPIPFLVPIIIGAVALATTGGGVATEVSARRVTKKTKKRIEAENLRHEEARRRFEGAVEVTRAALFELAQVKTAALESLRRAVEFLARARLREHQALERAAIPDDVIQDWEMRVNNAPDFVVASLGGGIVGASAAGLLTDLAAGVGFASTGAAIGGLSGAALESATLAWLGGGALAAGGGGVALGSVVAGGAPVGPGILVCGIVRRFAAERQATKVEKEIARIHVQQAEAARMEACLDGYVRRAEELRRAIRMLTGHVDRSVETADPDNQVEAYVVYCLGKLLVELVDTTVCRNPTGEIPPSQEKAT